jgi:hypothetical protein
MIFIAIGWYITGLMIFLTTGLLDYNGFYPYYYLWDKAKDVIFLAAILRPIPFKERWAVKPILIYAIIRFVWEIIVTVTGWKINDVKAMAILFLAMLAVCLYLMVTDLRKCLKQRQ